MAAFDPVADRTALQASLARPDTRLVVCLCAAWCGTCREYREAFDALAARRPHLCFVWVDIETHADWLGDFDIENFPTLLVQDANSAPDTAQFFGPLLPTIGILERMLDGATLGTGAVQAPELRPYLSAV
ncbi:thiol reductase thioredoxin [Pandoraea terrae]|uniref:Thiol reductase thioredoxin n=1 Tax=Pandoraea terrae TaxID=1537710 RepID=A0A5E4TBL1_9BURK|nr:thioredoxin family protein [Pandoraea terrae]VVD85177.1 thiol reductase thioredoxin [Pandoraea terrae]